MPKSLAEKLQMKHLESDDDEDVRRSIEGLASEPNELEEQNAEDDPRKELKYTFNFNYTDDRGKTWSGTFTSEVLDLQKRASVAAYESFLNSGQPYDSIPQFMRTVNAAIAHMTFSLVKREAWAKNLRKLHDSNVIFALFQEVAEHERVFLGRKTPEEGSEG